LKCNEQQKGVEDINAEALREIINRIAFCALDKVKSVRAAFDRYDCKQTDEVISFCNAADKFFNIMVYIAT